MKLYAIRMIKDQQPVGIYWADGVEDLADSCDETAPPRLCEYVEIDKPGAVIFAGECGWQMGINCGESASDVEERAADIHNSGEIVFADSLNEVLFDRVEGWRPFGNVASV